MRVVKPQDIVWDQAFPSHTYGRCPDRQKVEDKDDLGGQATSGRGSRGKTTEKDTEGQ